MSATSAPAVGEWPIYYLPQTKLCPWLMSNKPATGGNGPSAGPAIAKKPVTSAVTLTNVRITACLSTPQIKFLCQIECPGHSLVGRIPFRAKFVRKQEFIYLGRYLYLYHF